MNRKRNTKARGRKALRQNPSNERIPMFHSTVEKHHKFRFNASAAVNTNISANEVLGALGAMGTVTNSQVIATTRTFRIRKIEIWSPTSTSTTSATCSINWLGALGQAANKEISDISINISQPAHIVTRPPKGSLADFWQISGTSSLFIINCPGGSVVDLTVDYIEKDTTGSVGITVATAVVGVLYYLALDNTGSSLLVPVSVITTS